MENVITDVKRNSLLAVVLDRLARPKRALEMTWRHRRSLEYIRKRFGWKMWWNTIFVYWFIRGDDCGQGVIDPIFKFFPWLAPKNPWDIEIEITTACYGKCIMCEHTYWRDKSYLDRHMTFEQFKHIIDQFPSLKWINITGEGSPFLNPDFLKMLEYCKTKNIFVSFAYDFHLYNENIGRKLIELGIDKLWISFDGGTKEVYEQVRPTFNFNNVIKNIKAFIELKKKMKSPLPEICFRYTVMTVNKDDCIKFLELVNTLGDKEWMGDDTYVNFVSLLEFEETKHLIYEPTEEDLDKVMEKGKELNIKVLWSHPSHDESKKPPMDWCVCWTEPYIMINGDIVPDCGVLMSNKRPFLHKNAFGNLLKQSFREIWDSERYRKFRKMVVDPKGKVPIFCDGCRGFNSTERKRKYGVSESI